MSDVRLGAALGREKARKRVAAAAAIRDGMSTAEFVAAQRAAWSEDELQAEILKEAARHGWLAYHTHDSRRSPSGFPDLVLVQEAWGRMVMLELKREGEALRPEQKTWARALGAVATRSDTHALEDEPFALPAFEYHVARPSDWDEIERVLTARRL